MDILQSPPFFALLRHLGYPGYFPIILGIWEGTWGGEGAHPTIPSAQRMGLRRHVLQYDRGSRLPPSLLSRHLDFR
jgi:hypothetical protein